MYELRLGVFVVVLCLIVLFVVDKLSKRYFLLGNIVCIILMFTHLLFGVVRWQLYPLYLVFLIVVGLNILKFYAKNSYKTTSTKILKVLMYAGFILSFILNVAFPLYELPKPTGNYVIGTTQYVIEDKERDELYSNEDFRRFMIQVWYPAQTVLEYEQAVWLEGGQALSRSLAKDNYLPAFALDHAPSILSNSYYNAPLNEEFHQYPVIVISHGWRGFRTLHTDFAEELASQGFIVVSIDHTYGSVATVFGDDDVSYVNLEALKPRSTNPLFLEDANALVSTYGEDIIGTIDFLENLNKDVSSEFYGKLDMSSLGLVGHSTGGGAGVYASLKDSRIDALIGLDAWVEPIGHISLSQGITVPALFFRSESWETGENNAYLYSLSENSQDVSMYQINGTTHYDFAMVYMYSPLVKYIGFTGSLDSTYLTNMLRESMTEFFDVELNKEQRKTELTTWEEIEIIIPE